MFCNQQFDNVVHNKVNNYTINNLQYEHVALIRNGPAVNPLTITWGYKAIKKKSLDFFICILQSSRNTVVPFRNNLLVVAGIVALISFPQQTNDC